jgi:hypothetical protein
MVVRDNIATRNEQAGWESSEVKEKDTRQVQRCWSWS